MANKTARISKTRKKLIPLFSSYSSVARGIDDITEEDDIDDLENCVDELLENLLKDTK